ncbi:transporter [Lysobacter pythonis]|uniref:Transporter n=1 Tax=Solilutibacter pythonis TaxID=2483112 RepID=A0A3M2HKX7_9GAMM|nr:outer membrane protein transport protein [Lysobacter pythonis]RMH89015.1 transporter [Lysobacter pythonis]
MQHVSTQARLSALAVAVIGVLAVGGAAASGFQLRETSTKAGGRAYAGTTVATNDTAVVAGNPAAMVNNDSVVIQAGVGVVDLKAQFTGGGVTALGTPLTGNDGGNPGSRKLVPSLGVIVPMKGALEGLTLGASLTAPFGSGTEYQKGWVGRYNATETSMKTADLTLSAAVQITPAFSAGVGLVYERAQVTLGKDLPLGVMLAGGLQNPALAATPDGNVSVEGSDNGFGWVAGMQFRPSDKFALGYSHRSEIKHDFNGDATFTMPQQFKAMQPGFAAMAGNPAAPLTAAQRQQLMVLGRGFVNTQGRARFVTPTIDTVSVMVGIGERVKLYGEAQRTGWSSLQNVNIDFANPYQPVSHEDFRWKDTMFYSIGADFALSDAFTLRAGVGYDESPTNNVDRTPRLPDNNRNLYSLGMSWQATPNLSVDASFTHVAIKNSTTNLPINPNPPYSRYTSLKGDFSGRANVLGLGATYKF